MSAKSPDGRAAEVLRLHYLEGASIRHIAKKMRLSRKTVRQLLGQKPFVPQLPRAPRSRSLDPYRDAIRTMLSDAPEMRATSILERLRTMGYKGGITVVRDLARELRPRATREAFLTLTHAPAQIAQVDWADFGYALPGCPRRVSAFVMVFAYSRMMYLEFTLSQSQGSLLRCMERACRFFGGITHIDVFDNMRTVVLEHKTVPVFHPRFVQYAAVRGFAITACRPRTPTGKPDVERGIGFTRERFWPGRRFTSLLDLNQQAFSWRDEFANARVHETTGKVPSLVFEHEEKKLLLPVAQTPFDTDDLIGTGVTKTFRVAFDRNRYSVPPRLVSQSVVVRGGDDFVRVFLATKEVAAHPRSWGIGQDLELPEHRLAALATKQRHDSSALPAALDGLGETGRTYARLFSASSRSVQREMVRIVFLVELFGLSATKSAIEEVMKTGHVGAEYVEYILRHKRRLVPAPVPLRLGQPELDSLSLGEPDLSAYDRLFATRKTSDPDPGP
jgi:transposase